MTFLKKNKPTNNLNNYIMENTHEFKAVHDPLFCEEGDIPFDVHLVNKDGSEFVTIQEEFHNPKDIPACNPENDCSIIQDFIGEEDGSYDEYLRIKRDATREIIFREDKIQELLLQFKEHMLSIKNSKEEIDKAFSKYISTQWQ